MTGMPSTARNNRITLAVAAVVAVCVALSAGGPGCARRKQVLLRPDLFHLEVKGRRLTIEVARTDRSRQRGLMHRDQLAENRGMLFVYRDPEKLSFWMRNTKVPLSIAFIDDHGKILQIEDMRPLDLASVASKYEVRYALEMNQGWFDTAGVAVGDTLEGFERRVEWFLQRAE